MKRIFLFITFISIIFSIFSNLFSGSRSQAIYAQAIQSQPKTTATTSTPTTVVTCSNPSASQQQQCAAWEQQILTTTIRIQVSGWLASAAANTATWTRLDTEVGHGTVMNGRYLVTHNHYYMPFDLLAAGRIEGLVSLFTSAGETLLSKADLNIVNVAYQDSQTLVLDFDTGTGQGLFDTLGVPSATFKSWPELDLQPGLEVAQLDWDSHTAHVDWVQIEAVMIDGTTPRLELDNFNVIGSSGGGVFWRGIHIANNWQRTTVHERGGTAISRQFSTAALNSLSVVIPLAAGG
jgi:hypothetical protein